MKYSYLFVIAVLGQGCLLKKAVVMNADHVMGMQIEKHLPLTRPQKVELSKDTDQFLNQTKPRLQEALPLLENLKLEHDLVENEYNQIKEIYFSIAGPFIQIYAKYVTSLDPKQQREFWKSFDEKTSVLKARTKRERLGKIEHRFEIFFDVITPEQKKILINLNQHNLKQTDARLEKRMALKNQLMEVFTRPAPLGEKEILIQKLYSDYHYSAVNHESNIEFLKKITTTLSKNQKKHFYEEVREIRELIEYFIQKKF